MLTVLCSGPLMADLAGHDLVPLLLRTAVQHKAQSAVQKQCLGLLAALSTTLEVRRCARADRLALWRVR